MIFSNTQIILDFTAKDTDRNGLHTYANLIDRWKNGKILSMQSTDTLKMEHFISTQLSMNKNFL